VRHTESIAMVMLNGRLYDGRTLAEMAGSKRAAPKFWWE
jgi:hypothetical protein